MGPRGFWLWAEAEPTRPALIEADGRTTSAGELLAACNQVAHGLRSRGLETGDCVAMLLPNGGPTVEVLLAVNQSGAEHREITLAHQVPTRD